MSHTENASLALITVTGVDRLHFLQGQITQDVRMLMAHTATPAALLNPQGRVIAVLWLLPDQDQIAVAMHPSVIRRAHEHLARCVLRAKVHLSIDPLQPTHADRLADTFGDPTLSTALLHGPASIWTHALINAGRAEITDATCERFVPQMLNLDLVGAISFSKGCYTGQEIVARTQHLGRIKRRLARFTARSPTLPELNAALLSDAEKVGEVVNAVIDGDELSVLAVVQSDYLQHPLLLENGTPMAPQPLPYAVAL